MKPRTILGLVVAAALGAAGYAAARDLVERTVGTGTMSGGMMSGGMMGDGMAGMMDGCRDMMQGGGMASQRPNAQWEGASRKAPPPDAEKQR
ncbi:MAG: hypothetical protein IT515_18520 [Burkholderiales bacterium]|nr:hypothetical protein [Burkholderiales bacterium]